MLSVGSRGLAVAAVACLAFVDAGIVEVQVVAVKVKMKVLSFSHTAIGKDIARGWWRRGRQGGCRGGAARLNIAQFRSMYACIE